MKPPFGGGERGGEGGGGKEESLEEGRGVKAEIGPRSCWTPAPLPQSMSTSVGAHGETHAHPAHAHRLPCAINYTWSFAALQACCRLQKPARTKKLRHSRRLANIGRRKHAETRVQACARSRTRLLLLLRRRQRRLVRSFRPLHQQRPGLHHHHAAAKAKGHKRVGRPAVRARARCLARQRELHQRARGQDLWAEVTHAKVALRWAEATRLHTRRPAPGRAQGALS